LSRRKKGPREERRGEHIEINLLSETEERRPLARTRRGCTLPFLGGGLLIIAFELAVRHGA
jgi:hypothetical protein